MKKTHQVVFGTSPAELTSASSKGVRDPLGVILPQFLLSNFRD